LERRNKEHAELAKSLSRNGKQVAAERSGHHVQLVACRSQIVTTDAASNV
jgi:hypothetical protein